jgi:hypothetical protein
MSVDRLIIVCVVCCAAAGIHAQPMPVPDAATQAFEAQRWDEAITAFRARVEHDADDGIAWLRIAQAQRERGEHEPALETLEAAAEHDAPLSMVELERARNLAALGQDDAALRQLEAADHDELRALELLEQASELAALRTQPTYQRVLRSVRRRVYPCESVAGASDFDFWVGRWEVRIADGTLVGHSEVTKSDGGCSIVERWHGAGGSSGTSINFFAPSKSEWRQVWAGSGGTLVDISGGIVDGAMRLEGTIEYVEPERIVAFRGTWSVLEGGVVRQLFEEFDLAAQTWQVWFDGYYRPVGQQ